MENFISCVMWNMGALRQNGFKAFLMSEIFIIARLPDNSHCRTKKVLLRRFL